MIQAVCPVTSVCMVGDNIYVLGIHSSELSAASRPGQFINIKVSDSCYPLLRRPFSVYNVDHDRVEVIFNIVGEGTDILSRKKAGDNIDVLGPLGSPYGVDDDYETALLVGGGLGVAPLPMVTRAVRGKRKIVTFLGARTKRQLVGTYLDNLHVATDDGSAGYRGTVVDLLRDRLARVPQPKSKIFACGPNVMLASLNRLATEFDVPCEVSLESAMACGIGICQGCPVERIGHRKKYSLVCKEGPVFDSRTVRVS